MKREKFPIIVSPDPAEECKLIEKYYLGNRNLHLERMAFNFVPMVKTSWVKDEVVQLTEEQRKKGYYQVNPLSEDKVRAGYEKYNREISRNRNKAYWWAAGVYFGIVAVVIIISAF